MERMSIKNGEMQKEGLIGGDWRSPLSEEKTCPS